MKIQCDGCKFYHDLIRPFGPKNLCPSCIDIRSIEATQEGVGYCRFFKSCPLVQPGGYTCQHDEEASTGYCGQFKNMEFLEGRRKMGGEEW